MFSKRQIIIFVAITLIFVFAVLPIVYWVTDPLLKWWVDLISDKVLEPIKILELPQPFFMTIAAFFVTFPLWSIAATSIILFNIKYTKSNRDRFTVQIKSLDEAKANLRDSINYIDELRYSLEKKAHDHEELTNLIDQLTIASEDKADELKAKLDAVAYVNRKAEVVKLVLSFILGVVASVIASSIWEIISK